MRIVSQTYSARAERVFVKEVLGPSSSDRTVPVSSDVRGLLHEPVPFDGGLIVPYMTLLPFSRRSSLDWFPDSSTPMTGQTIGPFMTCPNTLRRHNTNNPTYSSKS